ncbi:MAG: hypothetical protein ABI175_25195 [Polyangiales bacterium]
MNRLALVTLAIVSVACSSNDKDGSAPPPTDAAADTSVDCTFFAGTNCFTAFVESVADCLGPASGETGIVDIDGRSCTYASIGRRVAFATPLGSTIDGGSNGTADVHFTVTNMAGKTCLDHTEKKGDLGFKSVGPAGTFELSYVGNAVTLSCPDGTKKTGDVTKLRSTCGADFDQKLPGTYWSETLPKFVFHPGTTLVYQCYRLRGGDGDAGGD